MRADTITRPLAASELLADGGCSPQCLLGLERHGCACRCGGEYHGALRDAEVLPVSAAAGRPGSAWDGLAIAVAMVTAALGRHDVDLGQLADGTDPAAVIRVLVPMAAAGLRNCLTEDSVGQFLRDLGEVAAMQGQGPDGRPL